MENNRIFFAVLCVVCEGQSGYWILNGSGYRSLPNLLLELFCSGILLPHTQLHIQLTTILDRRKQNALGDNYSQSQGWNPLPGLQSWHAVSHPLAAGSRQQRYTSHPD